MKTYEIEVVKESISEECGCPQEQLIIGLITAYTHIDPDGRGHVLFDAGDWEREENFDCKDILDLRKKAHDWVSSLPISTTL